MTSTALGRLRRPLTSAAGGLLLLALTACTGRGGGQLPPEGVVHPGSASFGFSFTCEDAGGLNPLTGQLRIQLSYTERGASPLGSPFTIHGVADEVDPVLESALCIGQEPPPGGNELVFLGRYRFTSGGGSSSCPDRSTTASSCRFEVVVRDERAPHRHGLLRAGRPAVERQPHRRLAPGTHRLRD